MSNLTRSKKTLEKIMALDNLYLQFVMHFDAASLLDHCVDRIVLIFILVVVVYLNWRGRFRSFRHARSVFTSLFH